jgi:hypothetical protein
LSEEEYDLRKSADKIGELYPVIMSKTGEVVDGFHRLNAKAGWRREVREDIDTPEKVLVARLISNKFRRQVTAEEVRGWINDLAEIALIEHGIEPGEISGWVAEETGYSPITVRQYLDEKYLESIKSKSGKEGAEKKDAMSSIAPISDIVSAVKNIIPEVDVSIPSDILKEVNANKEVVDLESANGLHKVAKALEREANRKVKAQKTIEQLETEKTEKKRKNQENAAKKREQKIDKEEKLKERARQQVTKEVVEKAKTELLDDSKFLKEASVKYSEKITRELLKQTPREKIIADQNTKADKLAELWEETYYKVRGWGIQMYLAMGRDKWLENLWYIEAINKWTGWMLTFDPSNKSTLDPPREIKPIDMKRIIDAEYQIKEVAN